MNGDIKLTPAAEQSLSWHPLLGGEGGTEELAGGAVDGNFAKIEGLPLVDGTGYVGLAISIRFFWPPTGFDCEKIIFVQLVKNEPLSLPRVESGADETMREQLRDWMDNQDRNCCD